MSAPQSDRLQAAYQRARLDLLEQRNALGHWTGTLATSALSTATAVSALSQVRDNAATLTQTTRAEIDALIQRGVNWLISHQHTDGGWGDTEKSYSNIATTMLGVAALHLAGGSEEFEPVIQRAEQYIDQKGGVEGLRKRYGKDKTFAVPILTNCALAGIVPWKDISPLPFEAACVPQKWYRLMRMPVVSYAIPALVAIGQARYYHRKPRNPITRLARWLAVEPSLRVLRRMQPESGGYLEAIPLTSFVVMALASTGRAEHSVARSGVDFLRSTVRDDGSWPIDTNLATWNTTLSLMALANGGQDVLSLDCLRWLLSCQHVQVHAFTGADPGGWGWSDLSGAVPDADDTPGALLALAEMSRSPACDRDQQQLIQPAVLRGIRWLIDLQNRDGGWPTFCRGWGKLPFDRSGADLTAHAIRALKRWRSDSALKALQAEIDRSIARGFEYLRRDQAADGSWKPLWFGNQDHPREENPVYGTAKVLMAYAECSQIETSEARQGFIYLTRCNNADGGWGGGPGLLDNQVDPQVGEQGPRGDHASSVEETAIAVDALLNAHREPAMQPAINKGLELLCQKVEGGRHQECSPIGFYFAKLWYHERLYPLIFTVSALGKAVRLYHPSSRHEPPTAARLNAS